LFVNDVIAAKAANAMLYLSFLLSLLAFVRNGRAVVAVAVSIFVISAPYFSSGAADAMTDIGRVCFTALAIVFAYQYFRADRLYFLFASGLLAGGAIAGKYTELLTPLLIGASLLPSLIERKRDGWLAVAVFTVATVITGIYKAQLMS
jgi:4-amino-4-deoxy-L-arabinose transferase-like glycosyltransferase